MEHASEFHTCLEREVVKEISSMGDWLGWVGGYQFLGNGLRRLSRLRGFLHLEHCGLFRAHSDFRR